MNVTVTPAELPGVLLVRPDAFEDARGFFCESYHRDKLAAQGVDVPFVQDNHSRSGRGVVRGLHFQAPPAGQYRLVRCTAGEVFDVAVDLRPDSPTYGRWMGVRLSAANRLQVLLPPAFAHGFAVLSDAAEVQYKCSAHHDPAAERTLAWDDPDLAIAWPVATPVLSAKDRTTGLAFRAYRAAPLFPPTGSIG